MTRSLRESRVEYVLHGTDGPPVVLIHPIGFDRHTWDDVVPRLSDRYRVLTLDLPGHGDSDKPAGADYRLPSLAGRVVHLLDDLGWEDPVWVANSIGGGVSLAAAVQHPDRVRGLALVNSVGFRWGLPLLGRLGRLPLIPRIAGYTPAFAMRLGLDYARCGWGKVSPRRHELCSTYFRNAEGRTAFFDTLRQLYGPTLDELAGHYGEIQRPTLVVHGIQDPLVRLRHAEELAKTIPTAELVPLPQCGHFPQEECPERLADTLRPFLDRVSSSLQSSHPINRKEPGD